MRCMEDQRTATLGLWRTKGLLREVYGGPRDCYMRSMEDQVTLRLCRLWNYGTANEVCMEP